MPLRWLAPLLCGLLPLLVFFPALGAGFLIWDDNVNLLSNPALWRAEGAYRWMFTDLESVQRYKPINWLLWRALGDGFGLNPVVFHAANILLHAGSAILLFHVIAGFLRSLPRLKSPSPATVRLSAMAGTLVWAIHPLRVEPVAWISGAGYPLSTVFGLLCVLAFQRYLHAGRPAWQGVALLCFMLSLLSYPATAALPGLLLALAWLNTASRDRWSAKSLSHFLRLLGPYVAMAAALLGSTLVVRLTTSGEVWNQPTPLHVVSAIPRIAQAFAVWIWYLEKTVLPLHLAPVYVDFRGFSPVEFRAIVSLLVLLLTGVLAWRILARWPEAGPLWTAYLLLAVPVLGVTDLPFSPADRYAYVPSLALALLFSTGLIRLCRMQTTMVRLGLWIVIACQITGLTFISVQQLRNWLSPLAFFRHAQASIAPHPASADLHWRLGLHFLTMEQPAKAVAEFMATLRIDPRHEDAARYLRVLHAREAVVPPPPPVDAHAP